MSASGSKQTNRPPRQDWRKSVVDKDGMTLLHRAVNNKEYEQVGIYLGANKETLNLQNKQGLTPLHSAVKIRDWSILGLVLEKGAEVDIQDKQGRTALHFAAEKGYFEIVHKLLQHHAKVDIADKQGWTALHLTVSNRHTVPILKRSYKDTVQNLLAKGADPTITSTSGKTPIHVALESGDWELITSFAEQKNHKINVEAIQVRGLTLLRLAVENLELKVVKLLLEKHGANLNVVPDPQLHTLFSSALFSEDWETIKCLLRHKPDRISVNEMTAGQNSPLHLAVQNKDLSMIEHLVSKQDANVDVQNHDKETPLHVAVKSNIGHAPVKGKDGSYVPNEYHRAAKLLLDRGARVDNCDQYGETPLSYAKDDVIMVNLLQAARRTTR